MLAQEAFSTLFSMNRLNKAEISPLLARYTELTLETVCTSKRRPNLTLKYEHT
jgi:hypothetical protein